MPSSTPAFDWYEYYKLADGLATMSLESAKRSAISRAYYASYNKAERIYRHYNSTYSPGLGNETHYIVWNWFKTHSAENFRKIGLAGDRLKKSRIQADYHDKFPGLDQQVNFQVKNAESLINDLDRLVSNLSSFS